MKIFRKKSTRLISAVALGGISSIAAAMVLPMKFVPLVAWDISALTLISMLWWDFISGSKHQSTKSIALRDDMDRSSIDIVIMLASLASIGAVGILLTSKNAPFIVIGFGLISIIISWITVHTLYTAHYAARYFKSNRGINFEGKHQPNFHDFAYLAFTIGMTYQVSDTNFTSSEFRRMALGHALLSFIFGTAIIATTINFVASLSQ